MEPQRQQLDEEEKKLTTTLDALQKRVNDFRTQKETLKAQYTAAKAISEVDESTAGISKSFNDSGASLQRAQDKIATMQARSGALDELLESGVLEDVGGSTDDIQKELDQVGKDAQVDNELAALKAQLGTGGPAEPDALAAPPAPTPRRARGVDAGHVVSRRLCSPRVRHDVGQLRPAVLLEEVPSVLHGDVRSPGRTGHVGLQHLGPSAAWRDRRRRTRSGTGRRMRPTFAWCGGSGRAQALAGVRPMSSGSWRGPAQKTSSGNGAS